MRPVLLAEIVATSSAVAATRARTKKVAEIADLLSEAGGSAARVWGGRA